MAVNTMMAVNSMTRLRYAAVLKMNGANPATPRRAREPQGGERSEGCDDAKMP
jgi:hypothetical protein